MSKLSPSDVKSIPVIPFHSEPVNTTELGACDTGSSSPSNSPYQSEDNFLEGGFCLEHTNARFV